MAIYITQRSETIHYGNAVSKIQAIGKYKPLKSLQQITRKLNRGRAGDRDRIAHEDRLDIPKELKLQ